MNGRLDRGGARTTPMSRLPFPLSLPRLPSFVPPLRNPHHFPWDLCGAHDSLGFLINLVSYVAVVGPPLMPPLGPTACKLYKNQRFSVQSDRSHGEFLGFLLTDDWLWLEWQEPAPSGKKRKEEVLITSGPRVRQVWQPGCPHFGQPV